MRSLSLSMAVAAAFCSAPVPIWAAGLGSLTVQSGLGQTLRAEVAITALGDTDVGTLSVGLASPEAFRKAGLEYNPALTSLRFAIEPRNGGALVRVTSTQPVNEPFVDLMLELSWDAGRFVREYTFLLDPPELRLGQDTVIAGGSGQAIPLAPAVKPASTPATGASAPDATASPAPAAPSQPAVSRVAGPQPVTSRTAAPAEAGAPAAVAASSSPSPSAPPPSAPVRSTAASPGAMADESTPVAASMQETPPRSTQNRSDTIHVAPGDTASSIASRFKPADVTLEQAVIALYRANPKAFFGSVHQMLAGRDLTIPDDATIRAVDPVEARREIRTQMAAFDAWRSRLASSTTAVAAVSASQSVAGAVAPPVQEAPASMDAGDRLELSRPDAGQGSASAGAGASAGGAAEESRIAQQAALSEQQDRVAQLERNVADLQRLLELKNEQLAGLQQKLETAGAAQAPVTGTVDAGAPAPIEPLQPSASAPSAGAAQASAQAPLAQPDPAGAASEAAPAPATASGTGDAGQKAGVAASDQSRAASPESAPGSWLDWLRGQSWAWPALIVVALLLGLFGLLARRRRQAMDFDDSITDVDAFASHSLFGTTGGQSIDTQASVFAPGAGPHAAAAPVTEVDPVAEADVYIAYGREAHAEDILRVALENEPERQPIRLKLLEMYAARRDLAAFAAMAQEMHDQTGGSNDEWPRVVALGREIDPDNALYGAPGSSAGDDDVSAGSSLAGVPGADVHPDDETGARVPMTAASLAPPGGWAIETGAGVPTSDVDAAAQPESPSAPVTQEAGAEEMPALDFDFDLGPEPQTTVERAGQHKPAGAAAMGAAVTMAGEPQGRADGSALEQAIGGAFELPSLDLGEGVRTGDESDREPADVFAGRADAHSGSNRQADSWSSTGDALDFDIDLPSFGDLEVRDGRMERPAVDLADLDDDTVADDFGVPTLNIDLAELGVDTTMAGPGGPVTAGTLPRWQEMDTKLDLAAAYDEIGDKEGARELLQEVLEGGDATQQDKARSMLTTIG